MQVDLGMRTAAMFRIFIGELQVVGEEHPQRLKPRRPNGARHTRQPGTLAVDQLFCPEDLPDRVILI
jgi:hypothetical protein